MCMNIQEEDHDLNLWLLKICSNLDYSIYLDDTFVVISKKVKPRESFNLFSLRVQMANTIYLIWDFLFVF